MSLKIFIVALLLSFNSFTYAQIPEGYYNNATDLSGEQLKSALHDIIKNHKEFPYTSSSTDVWDILKQTDKDTANIENVILFYSGWSVNAAQEYNNNTGWSREHVWAKSHGKFDTDDGVGTDVHHLRPCDISVNSARNNDDFDNGGSIYVDADGATECYTDSDSWEPRDAVKGDVARMLMYMAVRYEGTDGEVDLELVDEVNTFDLNETGKGYHGKLSTLLEWHKEDPVDSFEINRNNVIYTYQENRNPFIDHPEYVTSIWDTAPPSSDCTNDSIPPYINCNGTL
jgi:endonuclease I